MLNEPCICSNRSSEDPSQSKIAQLADLRSKRVLLFGWVHRLRQQKDIIFIVVRDGTGYLQTVLSGRVVSRVILTRQKMQ